MGLYDTIICNYPLPRRKNFTFDPNDLEYQSKDLVCCLAQYTIDKNGQLWQRYTDFDNKKQPKPTRAEATQSVNFYTSFDGSKDYGWLEYVAFFDNGKLIRPIKLIKYKKAKN